MLSPLLTLSVVLALCTAIPITQQDVQTRPQSDELIKLEQQRVLRYIMALDGNDDDAPVESDPQVSRRSVSEAKTRESKTFHFNLTDASQDVRSELLTQELNRILTQLDAHEEEGSRAAIEAARQNPPNVPDASNSDIVDMMINSTHVVETAAEVMEVNVAGSVGVMQHNTLEIVTFPVLTFIGGHLCLYTNARLSRVELPVLENVRMHLSVYANNALGELVLSSLKSLGTYLSINNNALLSSMHLPALESIGQYLYITFNPSLTSLALNRLVHVGEELLVSDNAALQSIDIPKLSAVATELQLTSNDVLTSVSMAALRFVGGSIDLSLNPNLVTVHMPLLVHVGGEFIICSSGPHGPSSIVIEAHHTALDRIDVTCIDSERQR